jgi:hypothetical protein
VPNNMLGGTNTRPAIQLNSGAGGWGTRDQNVSTAGGSGYLYLQWQE